MNWFNLEDLENRLVENKVSDKEGFNYLLANLILFGLASYVASDSYNHRAFLLIEIILMIAITVGGLNLTFKANENGDGNDYLKRFLSLYFVIGIRFVVFTFLLAIPVGIIGYFIFGGEVTDKTVHDLLNVGFLSGITIVFYYFLVRSFKKVAQHKI